MAHVPHSAALPSRRGRCVPGREQLRGWFRLGLAALPLRAAVLRTVGAVCVFTLVASFADISPDMVYEFLHKRKHGVQRELSGCDGAGQHPHTATAIAHAALAGGTARSSGARFPGGVVSPCRPGARRRRVAAHGGGGVLGTAQSLGEQTSARGASRTGTCSAMLGCALSERRTCARDVALPIHLHVHHCSASLAGEPW
jgi:hypothetical protein